jgi:hypothetical protein
VVAISLLVWGLAGLRLWLRQTPHKPGHSPGPPVLPSSGGTVSVQNVRDAGAAIGFMMVAFLASPLTFAHAQSRKSDARLASLVNVEPPPAAVSSDEGREAQLLTLRPAPGLELLAQRVARVLSLRFGTGTIRVSGPPPPGLIEAVPAGHLALAREGERVHLVLGAAFGASFEASLPLGKTASEPDVRSLALAVEALRDRVLEAADRSNEPAARLQPTAAGSSRDSQAGDGARDHGSMPSLPIGSESQHEVKPMFFVRAYSGASNESKGPRMGIATGGGLCVQGYCLVIGFESPLPYVLEASATDVRYRYPTITSSFYSRPWQFGIFAPAASIGFLSRVGYFSKDMGIQQNSGGLDTDLGVRGALEGSFALGGAFELTSEFGLDYALDRWQLGSGETVTSRGDRATVWAQAGIRLRPY